MKRWMTFSSCKSDTPARIIDGVLLSGYEQDFLRLLCSDATYKEVGVTLHKSSRTLEHYRDALFVKLNIHTRIGLVVYAIKHGIFIVS